MFRVNVVTGELCMSISDVFVPGLIPIDFTRVYKSAASYSGPLGPGWSHRYDLALARAADHLVFVAAGQEKHRFSNESAEGPYVLNARDHWWQVSEPASSTAYFFRMMGNHMPVSAIQDAYGNSVRLKHDERNRLVGVIDPFGRHFHLDYEGPLMTGITLESHGDLPVGATLLSCSYDANGRLVRSVDVKGAIQRFEYEGSKLVAYTNALGGMYCAEYDDLGRCVRYWERDGTFTRGFAYDTFRRTTCVTDSFGHAWMYRFDEQGLVTESTDPHGGVVRFAYDSAGGLISSIDPAGDPAFVFGADHGGKRLFEMLPPGAMIITELGAHDEVIALVDAAGHRWTYEENVEGDVTKYRSPSGHVWTMDYDNRGSLSRTIDPDGAEVISHLSVDGRTETVRDSFGLVKQIETDSLGRIVRYAQGEASVTVEHGPRGRTLTNVDGTTQLIDQNAVDLPVRYRDEIGAEWHYEWDPYGRLISIGDPLGHSLQYAYDLEGRPLSLTNQRGEQFENTIDALGRIVGQVEFHGGTATFEYNEVGSLVRSIAPDGVRIDFKHNPAGTIVEERLKDGTVRARDLDEAGRLVRADDPEGVLELQYDAAGRLLQESFDGAEIKYEYGWHMLPLRITYLERETRFAYDSRIRLISVEEKSGPCLTISYPDDCGSSVIRFGTGLSVTRDADANGCLTRQEVRSSSGAEIFVYEYRYDAACNLIERRRTGRKPVAFRYTKREELATVERDGRSLARYEYDSAGNRSLGPLGRSEYGHGSTLTRSPQGRYDYDHAGRPTGVETGSGRIEYRYDDLGRTVGIRLADGASAEFSYDALFRRRTKATQDGVRRTIWTKDVPLDEELPRDVRIKYMHDPTTEAPLAIEIGGEWCYVIRDGHGDVTDLIRARDEKVVWSAESLGFETAILVNDLAVSVPLRAVGQLFDEETGLIYQRARYYDPQEGRFLTPDPLGPAGGVNPYMYCLNQPLLWVDPRGLENPCLSREECEVIRRRIRAHGRELRERWDEMRNPKSILPFTGLSRAAGRRAAAGAVAPGAQGAPNFGTKGTVESHVDQYEQHQEHLNNELREYDRGQCHKHETKADRKQMKEIRKLRNKRPELHPDYGKKGATLPNVLRGRVTIG